MSREPSFCALCGESLDDGSTVWLFVAERVAETKVFVCHEDCFRRIADEKAVALLDRRTD